MLSLTAKYAGALDGEPSAAVGEARGAHVAHSEGPWRVPGRAETGDPNVLFVRPISRLLFYLARSDDETKTSSFFRTLTSLRRGLLSWSGWRLLTQASISYAQFQDSMFDIVLSWLLKGGLANLRCLGIFFAR